MYDNVILIVVPSGPISLLTPSHILVSGLKCHLFREISFLTQCETSFCLSLAWFYLEHSSHNIFTNAHPNHQNIYTPCAMLSFLLLTPQCLACKCPNCGIQTTALHLTQMDLLRETKIMNAVVFPTNQIQKFSATKSNSKRY